MYQMLPLSNLRRYESFGLQTYQRNTTQERRRETVDIFYTSSTSDTFSISTVDSTYYALPISHAGTQQ